MYNHQLDAFIKVADLGSFGKAAESMYISSPAIIQQINLLERHCDFKLFNRSNRGVKLTPAGQSLYEDAKTLIRLSDDALSRARLMAEAFETTVRIGTSLLYKCRLLPTLWAKISEQHPDLKIEILPMAEYISRGDSLAMLGVKYDLWEGIYGSDAWRGRCQFLELCRTPVCCAVSPTHHLAKATKLSMRDLNGEHLVMPITGVSLELDAFRNNLLQNYPTIKIIDSSYYGVDTFTMCEVNPYILITQPVYSDIHTNLITIPLETEYTMPYGWIYANAPSHAVKKFIEAARHLQMPIALI